MKSQNLMRLLLLGLNFLSVTLLGQTQGYLQLKDGTLMKGKVWQQDAHHVQWSNGKRSAIYHGTQLKAWGLDNGKTFHYVGGPSGDTSRTFKRCLVEGYARLYQYGNSYLIAVGAIDTLNLLELESTVEGVVRKAKKKYVGALTYHLRDCPAIFPAIQEARFELKALSNLVYQYNACVAPELENKKYLGYEQVHYEWGGHIGTSGNSVQLLTDDHLLAVKRLKFAPQWSYFAGLHFQANFKSGLSVRLGLNYSPKPTKGSGSTDYETFSATLNNTWLEVPVSTVYYFQKEKPFRPYLLGGGVANFSRLGENYRVVTQLNGQSRTTPLLLSNYGVGFTVGAGLRWQAGRHTLVDLEYFYQRTSVTYVFSVNFFAHHIHLRVAKPLIKFKSK